MKKAKFLVSILICALTAVHVHGAIVTNLTQSPGKGGNLDVTAGSYLAWGYATGSLGDGFDNFKSGTTGPGITNTTTDTTRDFGYTFTFNDGNSPVSGTTVATSGGQAALLNSGPHLTFSNIVSSSETRILTLYVGGFQGGGTDSVDITFNATLTGGPADESGSSQVFYVNSTTAPANYAIATYTVEFTSATEKDLRIEMDYSNTNKTRNSGLSGYTLAVIPEPSSFALMGLVGLAMVATRFRKK